MFCSKCGTSFATGVSPGPAQPYQTRRERRRNEKNEKDNEKGEKQEKGHGDLRGPLTGGGILIWLGVLIYLQQANLILGADFGGLFLVGVGALLVISGILGRTTTGRPLMGFIVGGAVAILIGFGSLRGFYFAEPFAGAIIFIFLGLLVILSAVNARRKSPAPAPSAPM